MRRMESKIGGNFVYFTKNLGWIRKMDDFEGKFQLHSIYICIYIYI